MNFRYVLITTFLFSSILFYNGCKKDSGSDPNINPSTTVSTTISGVVLDEFDSPVSGAQVSAAGQTTVTSSTGAFTFSKIQVPKDRFVVNVTKSNFFEGSVSDAPKADGIVNVRIYLLKEAASKTVSAAAGGTITMDNGSGVELAANTVVKSDGSAVNGNVKMKVAYLDPTSENFSSQIPGGDLRAQSSSGSQTTLYSYGIIKVDLQDESGSKVKIKSGSTSKITVDIPPSMVSSAPATIPLWYYDSATGLWVEEGSATKQGDKYVGNVAHFSDWNCDVPGGTGTVKGLVVDCNNAPVQGITVKIGQAKAITGMDGTFERRVPVNVNFEVQVLGNKNYGLSSSPIAVSGLAEGSIKDVGTIKIDCPAYVSGTLKCGTDLKYGQVVVSWTGGYSAQYTGTDGKFKIPVDINKSAQVSVNTFDGKYKMLTTTTPSARGGVTDLGTVEVCDQAQVGDNSFTLNGDGFTNKTFSFNNDTLQVFGYYDPDSSTTYVWMEKLATPDTIVCFFTFQGSTVGAGKNVMIYLVYNSKIYIAYNEIPGYNAVVNVTKYSGVGGLIEGTFSGTLYNIYTSYPYSSTTLSAGKFSVIRIVGQQQLNKFKSKTPKAYWGKLHLK